MFRTPVTTVGRAHLTHARIEWKTGDTHIAEVFGNGRLMGKKPGVSQLKVCVEKDGIKKAGLIYVIVED